MVVTGLVRGVVVLLSAGQTQGPPFANSSSFVSRACAFFTSTPSSTLVSVVNYLSPAVTVVHEKVARHSVLIPGRYRALLKLTTLAPSPWWTLCRSTPTCVPLCNGKRMFDSLPAVGSRRECCFHGRTPGLGSPWPHTTRYKRRTQAFRRLNTVLLLYVVMSRKRVPPVLYHTENAPHLPTIVSLFWIHGHAICSVGYRKSSGRPTGSVSGSSPCSSTCPSSDASTSCSS